jgi:hypothetical protein
MKKCDECEIGGVYLYVDGVPGKLGGWFCMECGRGYTHAEVEALDGEYDEISRKRMGKDSARNDNKGSSTDAV